MATRSTTPSSNLAVLAPTNALKRALSEDLDSDDDDLPDSKKIKLKSENNTPQAKDKKKRRKKKKKTPVVVPLELPANAPSAPPTPTALRSVMDSGKGKRKAALQAGAESGHSEERPSEAAASSSAAAARPPVPAEDEDQSATIARLNVQLKFQSMLLKKHETTLTQFNQSLTCQVCLDLLHKPYALAPCGHIACYNCLVAWFTAVPDEPHHYAPRRKTCPNCRATIRERPVEVWNIKDLVAALLKSGLLPGLFPAPPPPPALPGPPQPAGAQPDPWHNIFRYPHQHPMFQPPPPGAHAESGAEDMGMLDAEDGVYRCLDCMHEIWDGVCTGCQRAYAGHAHAHGHHPFDDDDEDDESGYGGGEMFGEESDGGGGALDPLFWPHFLPVGAIPALIAGGAPGGPQWWGGAGDSEDDDDDDDDEDDVALERAIREAEEEDGYDSFIDDDDDDDGAPLAAAIVEIDDDSSEDADGDGPQLAACRRPYPARGPCARGRRASRPAYVPSLRTLLTRLTRHTHTTGRADEPGPPASRRQPAPPSRRPLSC
ncbi:hypothetical protein B0H14DRAFT_2796663 [Mycena olivaceomarginata]|nr:hypothetical protein B0H14DRAFT_2796663 [Mycena olivaceomarginata]